MQMGRKKGPWLAWVKQGDLEQCEWLVEQFERVATDQQLTKKDKRDPELGSWLFQQLNQIAVERSQKDNVDLYDAIRTVVGRWADPNDDSAETDKIRKLCLMLQKRWGSHDKRTRNPGKRNYTLFMKKNLAPKIRALGALWNMNDEDAVEMLIVANAEHKKATENLLREQFSREFNERIRKLNDTIGSLNVKLAKAEKSIAVRPVLPQKAQLLRNIIKQKTAELEMQQIASRHWLMEIHTLKIIVRDMGVMDIPTLAQVTEAEEACAKTLQSIMEESWRKVEAATQTDSNDDAPTDSSSSVKIDTDSQPVTSDNPEEQKPVISHEPSAAIVHCAESDQALEDNGNEGEKGNPEPADPVPASIDEPAKGAQANHFVDGCEEAFSIKEPVNGLSDQVGNESAEAEPLDKSELDLIELVQLSARLMEIKRDIRRNILPGEPEYPNLIDRYCRLKHKDERSRAMRDAQIRSWMFDLVVSGYTFDEDKYPQINVEMLDDQSDKTGETDSGTFSPSAIKSGEELPQQEPLYSDLVREMITQPATELVTEGIESLSNDVPQIDMPNEILVGDAPPEDLNDTILASDNENIADTDDLLGVQPPPENFPNTQMPTAIYDLTPEPSDMTLEQAKNALVELVNSWRQSGDVDRIRLSQLCTRIEYIRNPDRYTIDMRVNELKHSAEAQIYKSCTDEYWFSNLGGNLSH